MYLLTNITAAANNDDDDDADNDDAFLSLQNYHVLAQSINQSKIFIVA